MLKSSAAAAVPRARADQTVLDFPSALTKLDLLNKQQNYFQTHPRTLFFLPSNANTPSSTPTHTTKKGMNLQLEFRFLRIVLSK